MKTVIFTVLALLAFAGNSVLCRLALAEGLMDAAGFTAVRLVAGAITLSILCLSTSTTKGGWYQSFKPSVRQLKGATLLFVYALSFSYAYMILDTGSGALILFGSVQLTLLIASFVVGKRPILLEWVGVLLAFVGLVYLLLPAWGTPSVIGFVLMGLSGLAWGLYTLAGKGSENPLLETSRNFNGCIPMVVVLCLFSLQLNLWTKEGLILAIISGALTSGVGYSIWYAVLPKLSISHAGVLQLLVPILAALGGVLFAAETPTLRLLISAVLVLGGMYLVIKPAKLSRTE